MPRLINIVGQKFGRLLVIKRVENRGNFAYWECLCDCGNTTIVQGGQLRFGSIKSCGCLQREKVRENSRINNRTHGMNKAKPYKVWSIMKERCSKQSHASYLNYGGRGITYDPKWETFEGFWEDMGPTYKEGLSIDRKNVNGNYSKDNCKWSTVLEQNNNRRNNTIIEINGETHTMADWARIAGITYGAIRSRFRRGKTGLDLIAPVIR